MNSFSNRSVFEKTSRLFTRFHIERLVGLTLKRTKHLSFTCLLKYFSSRWKPTSESLVLAVIFNLKRMKAISFFSLLICVVWSSTAKAQVITYKSDTTIKADTVPAAEPRVEPRVEPRDDDYDEGRKTIRYYETIPPREESGTKYYVKKKTNSGSDIKTLSGSLNHSGGFGALSFRTTEFRGEPMVLGGVRGGWIINRTLAIGFEAHGIVPTAKFDDIDPLNTVVTLGGYGGMFLEPIFFSNQVIHITFPVSAGSGWLGYVLDWEDYGGGSSIPNVEEDSDIFWYVEPGVDIEVNIARNFRLDLGVSKRFTQDLELEKTADGDFNGLNYFLTLKIGSF